LKKKLAEVHGNRTHRTRLPPNSTGFEGLNCCFGGSWMDLDTVVISL
jgi:hypothetical protein